MARRKALSLQEIHGEPYLAAIRRIVAEAQGRRSDNAFVDILNAYIGEEVFTRAIVRSLRGFGLPDGIAKTDEPLRNYLHYLAPFLPYTEGELREIAKGRHPDLSRLPSVMGEQKITDRLRRTSSIERVKLTQNSVFSNTILCEEKAMQSGDRLSGKQAVRLANLLSASLARQGYRRIVKAALDKGCIEGGDFGFSRPNLNAALRGDNQSALSPGDWSAIAAICLEVEYWDGNAPVLQEDGVTYAGRASELRAVLSLNGCSQAT